LLTAVGCASGDAARGSASLVLNSTVAPVTDIVRQVVGDRVTLVGLIPEGVDSHTFEASPATVKSLSRADVLFLDGLHLEGSILRQARANMRKGSSIVALGDRTIDPSRYEYDFTFPKEKGDPNPHLWMDPAYAKRFAEIVRDEMVRLEPAGEAYYRSNYDRFASRIDELDAAIAASIDSIPRAHRKLLTYHDSFAYLSRHYGIPVLGAVQPADFSEPSPHEIQRLIEQVRSEGVPAIFGSEVFPSKVLEQVAREAGARYVGELSDDELPGKPGDAEHTYMGMMVSDVRIITEALGGAAAPLRAIKTEATYAKSEGGMGE
jgi:ABC-type Zn uptake system ZnuABC Zn-binding protein ZnuA